MPTADLSPTAVLPEPVRWFRNRYYFRLNARRFEHLAQLGLDLAGRSVLEVGAGVGDHTSFFLDRGCRVTATEGREENFAYLRERFAEDERVFTARLDLDRPEAPPGGPWEVGYCYGVLYHLERPREALEFLAPLISDVLLLETVCGVGEEREVNLVPELKDRASQSLRGTGCRTTRPWVMEQLCRHFEHVYVAARQPWHPEFPDEWPEGGKSLLVGREVFVASRRRLENPMLLGELPRVQERC